MSNKTVSCEISNNLALHDIFMVTFLSIVMVVSIIGNMLTILAVCTSREMRKLTILRLVTGLACSDMGYALTVLPFIISRTVHADGFCHGHFFCYGFLVADNIFSFSSILWIFAIAVHKFITIRFPYRCSEGYGVGKKLYIVIISIVTISVLWSIVGLFDWEKNFEITVRHSGRRCQNVNVLFYNISYSVYLICLVLMGGLYIYILKVAFYHYQKIRTQSAGQQASTKRFSESKATRAVAIVYFAYCICWVPTLVINTIISADKNHFPMLLKQNRTLFYFIYYTFIQILPTLNCMVNPIIYGIFNTSIRTQTKEILNRVFETFKKRKMMDSTSNGMLPRKSIDVKVHCDSFVSPCTPL